MIFIASKPLHITMIDDDTWKPEKISITRFAIFRKWRGMSYRLLHGRSNKLNLTAITF